jgi:hypothetical protein
MLAVAFSAGPIGGEPGAPDNPVGIGPAGQVLELVGPVSFFMAPVLAVVALVGLALRFRRAQGVERQQLKWFAYGAFLLLVGLAALFVPLRSEAVAKAILAVGVGCFTAGVAVAVLRYGLYEIDVIINRTLVYGLLTAALGLGYAGVVLVGGQLAGQQRSNLVVAAATLAVAALFQPARRRIQAVVDRRFNRRKYDAARTVEAFSARLRDEVDLDALSNELLGVVDQTMQPTTASLWLRPRHRPSHMVDDEEDGAVQSRSQACDPYPSSAAARRRPRRCTGVAVAVAVGRLVAGLLQMAALVRTLSLSG